MSWSSKNGSHGFIWELLCGPSDLIEIWFYLIWSKRSDGLHESSHRNPWEPFLEDQLYIYNIYTHTHTHIYIYIYIYIYIPVRIVLIECFVRTPQLAILWMIRTVHLDLHTLIKLSIKNHTILNLFTHASNDIFILGEYNICFVITWCMSKKVRNRVMFYW